MRFVPVVLVVLVGCGGGGKKEDTVAGGGEDEGGGEVDPDDDSSQMCPPEVIDGITKTADRKRNGPATRCLTEAIDRGEAKKNLSGEATLEWTVMRDGSTSGVSVTRSSLDNQVVESCLVEMIEKTTFNPCPTDFTTSYTFAFEGG